MWLGGLERRGRLGRDRQRGLNVDHLCVHRMWQEWELKGSPKACKVSGEADYLDLTITWKKQKMLWSRVWKVSYVNDVPLYVDIYVCRSKGTCVYTCAESRGLHQGSFFIDSNLVFETGLLIGPRDELISGWIDWLTNRIYLVFACPSLGSQAHDPLSVFDVGPGNLNSCPHSWTTAAY